MNNNQEKKPGKDEPEKTYRYNAPDKTTSKNPQARTKDKAIILENF